MGNMQENDPAVVWEIVKKVGVSMVVTRDGENLEGRPLQAYPDREAGMIHYMTDSEHVIAQVSADGRLLLSFADKGGNNYAAIDGRAVVTNDRAKIKELWTVWAEAFWDSPDDPAIRVITVTPEHARYWDAPNAVVTTFAMIAGAVSGKQPDLGTSGDVKL